MKIKTIYQAGYYSGNKWEACGYGRTQQDARKNLKERMLVLISKNSWMSDLWFKNFRYKEQSFQERSE